MNATPNTSMALLERAGWMMLLALGAVVLGLFGWVRSMENGLWLDEALTLFFVEQSWDDLLALIAAFEINMSLYYVLLKALGGGGEVFHRLVPLLSYLGALVVLFLQVKKYWSLRAALIFGLLFMVHFFLVRYSVEARSYATTCLTIALLWSAWLQIVFENRARYWIVYAVLGGLALYLHLFSAFFVLALGVITLPLLKQRSAYAKWTAAHAVIVMAFVPLAAFVIFRESSQLAWVEPIRFRALVDLAFMFSGAAPQADDMVRRALLGVMVALLVAFVVAMFRGSVLSKLDDRRRRFWLSTAALFLLPVIVVYALSLYKPIFSARFFLPLIMFFLISIATAIDGLFGRRSIFAVAVLAGLMTMSAYSFASHEVLSWRKYIGLMHAECRGPEGVLFMTPNSQVGFNYYTRGITVAEGCAFSTYPYELKAENYLWKPDDYPALLDALASQHRVWIFESHSSEAESEILASYRRQIEAHFPHCRQMTDVHTLRLWACVR